MAVEPILASSLWTGDDTPDSFEPPAKKRKLATGCAQIDDSLGGGFDYGSISCISSEAESGGKELAYSLIATHLLSSSQCEATIVDTTNSFDVRRLHKRLVSGLHERRSGDDAKTEAVQGLERVRIMKAFDFVGMTECVAELRESLETRGQKESQQEPESSSREPRAPAPRGTVGDSEDEDDMLDDIEPVSLEKPPPPNVTEPEEKPPEVGPQHLLVIDNITYVASPIIKDSHVQGQALLATFMRSLAHLTRAHDICTLLHNAVMTYQPKSTTESTPSIFSSCTLRPALGKSFAHLLDVHLLLHRVPLTAADAKSVYAAHSAIAKSSQRLASVLEVLQDRHSDRIGHWSAFKTDADGNLSGISA
ncbi:hypothetical protein Q7P35_003867 [Cladosporium inversicolor]